MRQTDVIVFCWGPNGDSFVEKAAKSLGWEVNDACPDPSAS